ncbi:sporulation protein YqfD [Paenibacillus sp. 598K]|uniref:sporulation protein YqfD n=1 Tax=Paenibacillus sp. 598K TaxID=1117987 RepID=UPI000FFA5E8E|nr:sporulation protein YqfD [Paenibacillus sp. 598K]GBF75422.1 sporulation protein YqfD [Paenibacillus sp. 598K]
MRDSWLQTLQGIVTVRIRGGSPSALVNEAGAAGVRLWSIRYTSEQEMDCELTVGDFFRLRPILKRTSCRIHVIGRRGLPFWLRKLERRKFFAAGLFLFLAGLYLLSCMIWDVEVKGNVALTEEQVLSAAEAEGIRLYQWSFRMLDVDVLSRRLAQRLPEAAWVGVDKRGTKITIEVVENRTAKPPSLYTPRHLIAAEDAVVTRIIAETGRPVVKKDMRVKRGDILISGTIGALPNTRTVVAKGEVRGLVWHSYSIELPLKSRSKAYTGESATRWRLLIGGRSLQISGFGKPDYEQYEVVEQRQQMSWRGIALPFGRIKETVRRSETIVREMTPEEARAVGLQQARAELWTKLGPDIDIRAENLLHEKTENGKVYMKVLFEVEQSISTDMPLVQMQGE